MPTTWMPIYWGDYFKNTFHLTTEEHGAYFLLMGYYWQNGKIPRDIDLLKDITRLNEKKLTRVMKFFSIDGTYYIHERIDFEKAQAFENKGKQFKRTEAATKARWKRNVSVTDNVTSTPSPAPSPSTEEKEKINKKEKNVFFSESMYRRLIKKRMDSVISREEEDFIKSFEQNQFKQIKG